GRLAPELSVTTQFVLSTSPVLLIGHCDSAMSSGQGANFVFTRSEYTWASSSVKLTGIGDDATVPALKPAIWLWSGISTSCLSASHFRFFASWFSTQTPYFLIKGSFGWPSLTCGTPTFSVKPSS